MVIVGVSAFVSSSIRTGEFVMCLNYGFGRYLVSANGKRDHHSLSQQLHALYPDHNHAK